MKGGVATIYSLIRQPARLEMIQEDTKTSPYSNYGVKWSGIAETHLLFSNQMMQFCLHLTVSSVNEVLPDWRFNKISCSILVHCIATILTLYYWCSCGLTCDMSSWGAWAFERQGSEAGGRGKWTKATSCWGSSEGSWKRTKISTLCCLYPLDPEHSYPGRRSSKGGKGSQGVVCLHGRNMCMTELNKRMKVIWTSNKAVARRFGIDAMGSRCNMLMTIQAGLLSSS